MAIRKQDFDDNEHVPQPKKRSRITIDVSPELRRRIKIVASTKDMSISDYLTSILEQSIPDEASIIEEKRPPMTREAFEKVMQAREKIAADTHGHVFEDSVEIIRRMREERTRESEER